jgi:CheY-like chemotaxis protein
MPTVLIVDDARFSRGRLRAAIQALPIEIEEAADGLEALERYAACGPELVITDLLMPRMNGLALLTELRDRGSEVPVIVVTADIQRSSRAACEAQGISGFLHKPFAPEELRAAVFAALESIPAALQA